MLSKKLSQSEKLNIIKKEYDIPLEEDLRKDVSVMCNLSQGIEDKAVARIVLNMHRIGYTSNQIADAVGIRRFNHNKKNRRIGLTFAFNSA